MNDLRFRDAFAWLAVFGMAAITEALVRRVR